MNTSAIPGLQRNLRQFLLLVLVNALVGALIGLERTLLPQLGNKQFHISSQSVLFSFVLSFGLAKSLTNYGMTLLLPRFSRKQLLVLGWLIAIPVPFLLMFAQSWWWIIAANILLGINQGMAWSATVIMKVDLAGPRQRGLAMGINEFAGYAALGLAAFLSGKLAAQHGIAFFPFIPALFFVGLGLFLSWWLIKDTRAFVQTESESSRLQQYPRLMKTISWQHRNMGTTTINGMINNLNDGVVWVVLPLILTQRGYTLSTIGLIAGIYPAVWGLAQLWTGRLGDLFCKKQLLIMGMTLQSIALVLLAWHSPVYGSMLAAVLLGLGTALVYPNMLSLVAQELHPQQRAAGLSIFRFWRDSGYVFGALLAALLSKHLGLENILLVVAVLTLAGALLAQYRMCCTQKLLWKTNTCAEALFY